MQKLGFIGTGSMARALVQAAAAGGHGESCVLANRTPEKAQRLAEKVSGHWVKTNAEAAKAAEFLFLGVKPYQMAHVLQEISPVLDERRAAQHGSRRYH